MSAARAKANQGLYLARIVLSAWREARDRQDIPGRTVDQAFRGGAREHLVHAYGWFLLAIAQVEALPEVPPRSCADLPPVPEGKVYPGEINEFRQLEANGWLGDMLAAGEEEQPASRRQDNLAVAASGLPGVADMEQWQAQLAQVFDRMADSLDEY